MKLLRVALLFALLMGFWLLLSGRFSVLFVGMGVVSAAVCTWFGYRLLELAVGAPDRRTRLHLFWYAIYLGWLVGRMAVGAIQVARIVLDPRHPPNPGLLRFRTELASPAARTMLANSITMVPGTITLEIEGDQLTVHSFSPGSVDDLADGKMQNRIAAVFRDADQPVPEIEWEFGEAPRDQDPESREGFDPSGRGSR